MQAFAIENGALLQGEYRLIERIGEAGSSVFRARRVSDGRVVAVRIFRVAEHARLDELRVATIHRIDQPRLLELARAASRIRHPSLALVEGTGQLEDGTCFIVSELVEGTHLDAWADVHGIAPMPCVIDLIYRVCAGLNAAHRNGLSHAGLYPRNFLVRETQAAGAAPRLDVKLLDLGVPTFTRPWPPPLHAALFMAPEQLLAALPPAEGPGAEPTSIMNVYSCGALLYYLCTGGAPHPSKSLEELLAAHAAQRLVPASRINPLVIPALDSILMTALEPDPNHRFATASELANALISIRFERSLSGVRPRSALSSPPGARDEADITRDRIPTREYELDAPTQVAFLKDIVAPPDDFEERPTSETLVKDWSVRPPAPPAPLAPLAPATTAPPPVAQVDALDASDVLEDVSTFPPPRATPPPPPPPIVEPVTLAPDVLQPSRAPQRARSSPLIWIGAAGACLCAALWFVVRGSHAPEQRVADRTQVVHDVSSAVARAAAREVERAGSIAPPVERAEASARLSVTSAEAPLAPIPGAPERRGKPADARNARGKRERDAGGKRSVSEPESPALVVRPAPAPAPAPASAESEIHHDEIMDSEDMDALEAKQVSPVAPQPSPPPQPAPKPAVKTVQVQALPKLAPLPVLAQARVFDLSVKGSLATSQVRRGLDRIAESQRGCYRAARGSTPTSELGELRVDVQIDERGRARSARASGDAPASLKRCLEAGAQGLVVPAPDTGGAVATWKVSITP